MGSKLKAGHVATIRINPTDCMSVLDVVKAAGLDMAGMSFAQATSLALSSLLETMRTQGIIPERDGFEYLDMMGRYLGNGKTNAKKKAITDTIQAAGSSVHVKGLSRPRREEPQVYAAEPVMTPLPAEVREASRRLTELCQKKDMAESKVPGILWSQADEEEYKKYYKIVYPEG